VENQGYLATHLTQQARLLDKDGDVEVSLELDAGCDLLMGQSVVEIGDLAGREERRMPYDPWRRPWGGARGSGATPSSDQPAWRLPCSSRGSAGTRPWDR